MFDLASKIYPTAGEMTQGMLREAQHFHIAKDVHLLARSIGREYIAAGAFEVPADKPAGITFLEVDGEPDIAYVLTATTKDGHQATDVTVFYKTGEKWAMGFYRDNTNFIALYDEAPDEKSAAISKGIIMLAAIMASLLCEPRVVKIGTPQRAYRRRAVRAGLPEVTWKTASFTIGEEVQRSGQYRESDIRMPLHYCRGHWRSQPKGETGNSQRRAGRKGWWNFIPGIWRGHPDFGISLKSYRADIKRGAVEPLKTIAEGAVNEWAKQSAITE